MDVAATAATVSEPPPAPVWLTAAEAARRARCCEQHLYRSVRRKKIRAARLGRKLVFRPEWVDQFLERTATPIDE
jgi:excisionase family DNA binding protein